MGKEKKKNCFRSSKKRAPTVLSLNFDSFEQFGLLKLIPPRTYDMVEKSVVELQEKKNGFLSNLMELFQLFEKFVKSTKRLLSKAVIIEIHHYLGWIIVREEILPGLLLVTTLFPYHQKKHL